jgi:hypothetical protein
MSLLALPQEVLQTTKAKNNFLAALHQKKFSDTWLLTACAEALLPAPALSANFIFEEKHELLLSCAHLPFLDLVEEWAKPWHWTELSSSLAYALLEEALNYFSARLPLHLQFSSFSSKPVIENNKFEGFAFRASRESVSYRLDLYAQHDFPFKRLAQALNLTNTKQQFYPDSLFIELPMQLASTPLPAQALKTLHKGDIILIS